MAAGVVVVSIAFCHPSLLIGFDLILFDKLIDSSRAHDGAPTKT
jgi:hypothetical protein